MVIRGVIARKARRESLGMRLRSSYTRQLHVAATKFQQHFGATFGKFEGNMLPVPLTFKMADYTLLVRVQL